jgi:hypothetical protein
MRELKILLATEKEARGSAFHQSARFYDHVIICTEDNKSRVYKDRWDYDSNNNRISIGLPSIEKEKSDE